MIRYSLHCDEDHTFDSWFRSGEDYDSLRKVGMLSCPICGSENVSKSMMSPQVKSSGTEEQDVKTDLSKPASPAEQAISELRNLIKKQSEYVGREFPSEARAIHFGDAPKRSIYGEAKPDEAQALLDDGILVAPIPWVDSNRTN